MEDYLTAAMLNLNLACRDETFMKYEYMGKTWVRLPYAYLQQCYHAFFLSNQLVIPW